MQVGSCFLSDVENQYVMIDLECLAAAWVIRKCRPSLEGFPSFKLITCDSACRCSANSSALSLVSLKTHVFGCQAGTTWWMVPLRLKRLQRPSVFLSPDQLSERNGRFKHCQSRPVINFRWWFFFTTRSYVVSQMKNAIIFWSSAL